MDDMQSAKQGQGFFKTSNNLKGVINGGGGKLVTGKKILKRKYVLEKVSSVHWVNTTTPFERWVIEGAQ